MGLKWPNYRNGWSTNCEPLTTLSLTGSDRWAVTWRALPGARWGPRAAAAAAAGAAGRRPSPPARPATRPCWSPRHGASRSDGPAGPRRSSDHASRAPVDSWRRRRRRPDGLGEVVKDAATIFAAGSPAAAVRESVGYHTEESLGDCWTRYVLDRLWRRGCWMIWRLSPPIYSVAWLVENMMH